MFSAANFGAENNARDRASRRPLRMWCLWHLSRTYFPRAQQAGEVGEVSGPSESGVRGTQPLPCCAVQPGVPAQGHPGGRGGSELFSFLHPHVCLFQLPVSEACLWTLPWPRLLLVTIRHAARFLRPVHLPALHRVLCPWHVCRKL